MIGTARRALLVISSLVIVVAQASAQSGSPWPHSPTVAVIGAHDDPRHALVDEAVAFWNETLLRLGSGFRIGAVARLVHSIPEARLQELSRVAGRVPPGPIEIPSELTNLPGDITVFLADSDLVSFAGPFDRSGQRVVGIRPLRLPEMNLPNVARNVIAHELGHAIGMSHNSDPTALMCGRPATCRPVLYWSERPHLFPLIDDDVSRLMKMYPSTWAPGKAPAGSRRSTSEQARVPGV